MKRKVSPAAHAGILLLVSLLFAPLLAVAASAPAPLTPKGVIEGHYIVVLRPDVHDPGAVARDLARQHGFEAGFVYAHALKGFSAALSPRSADALRRNPLVDFIEADQMVRIMSQSVPTGIRRVFAMDNPGLEIDGVDDWRVDADVAVLDTGIDATHPDLHVVTSVDCSGGSPWAGSCKSGGDDGNGHGTHVAGTIAAIDNGIGVVGVAPGARLWSVKVLRNDGSGYMSWIIAGIDWVTARAHTVRVANMSLGCECTSQALDQAITNSVKAGVSYVVSAGNSAKDAETFSPARHPDVITVSALADFDGLPGGEGASTCRQDTDDTLANFSNFGRLIDIAAPGVCILSTWPGAAYRTLSGTSMAAPHAAGAAAILVASGIANPEQVRAELTQAGNLDWVDTSGDGHHEPLLDVGDGNLFAPVMVAGTAAPPGEAVASVSIHSPANGTSFLVGDNILFEGAADDGEGGDLSLSLRWTSSIDGEIGTGASFTAQLAAGEHTITAQIEEPAASASVVITVSEAGTGALLVESISYQTSGGRNSDRHLTVTVAIADADGPAGGVSVEVVVANTTTGASWQGTSTTDSNGNASYSINNHPAGCYETKIVTLNGEDPGAYEDADPGYCK
ncbi:S8 family serine peptidase [Thioalkalivibrio thiocyanodenitrificans]|uniref:S8 family serine peptidase n=1 Tax=Thioalkalivibrio thiocyanodenitrificans TaxID=243063 RepID=UPI0003715D04|nr:S8 family serine peptidase [Thioalkalivibrio thiocyanodenitrificans]